MELIGKQGEGSLSLRNGSYAVEINCRGIGFPSKVLKIIDILVQIITKEYVADTKLPQPLLTRDLKFSVSYILKNNRLFSYYFHLSGLEIISFTL